VPTVPQDHPSLFSPPSQIALPLDTARKLPETQRLVIGNANARVIEALQNPARWPFRVAVLTGPPRSGKSLIGRWAAEQQDIVIEVVDDAEQVDETQLFHRWNAVQEGGAKAGTSLLVIVNRTADEGAWRIALPDLASRIGGSLQLAITEPDDAMAAELIDALAEQRGLSLPEGAADYLVPRTIRSFAALEALVAAIDRISLERQAPATMSIWRAALEALQGPEQQRLL
jgi:hypothetical protein